MSTPARLEPKVVINESVVNQSDRLAGVRPRAICLHSTESHPRPGDADLQAVVGWFDNPSAQASSHVIVDDDGHSARCVPDARKAWTCAAFNSLTLNVEMIGFASQGKDGWKSKEKQLVEVARWLAEWSHKHDIPLQRGEVSQSPTVAKEGVVTHKQLGAAGGNHHDPGDFPLDRVLDLARDIKRARYR